MTKGQHLGDLEVCVLLAIERVVPEAYGATIRQEIARTGRRAVTLGSVYSALTRLEEKGMVSCRLSEPVPVRGGRARRLYQVTRSGRAAMNRASGAIVRLLEGLDGNIGGAGV